LHIPCRELVWLILRHSCGSLHPAVALPAHDIGLCADTNWPNGYPIASPPGSPSGASDGRLILHPFIGKKTSLMKDVQHGETRHNDHRRQPNHHQHSC
jgi:hypothetical protein